MLLLLTQNLQGITASVTIDCSATTAQTQNVTAVASAASHQQGGYAGPSKKKKLTQIVALASTEQRQQTCAVGMISMAASASSLQQQRTIAQTEIFDAPLHDFMELLLMAA